MTVVKPVPLLNAANVLTVVRMVLVPVFVVFVVAGRMTDTGWQLAAGITFVVASATDYVDGWIARTYNLVTSFGKVVDPIADKALVTMALVGLSVIGEVWWWVTIVVLVREWGITAVRFWVIRHGVMAAGRGGKVKTLLQTFAIGLFVIPRWTLPLPDLWEWAASICLGAAVVVTVVTGVDYLIQALRLRRTSPRAERKRAERAERAAAARERRSGS
jgi:CDP-diacylglycerol---glycerol-3-phosphate 3-phosphatidyltransferase